MGGEVGKGAVGGGGGGRRGRKRTRLFTDAVWFTTSSIKRKHSAVSFCVVHFIKTAKKKKKKLLTFTPPLPPTPKRFSQVQQNFARITVTSSAESMA